MIDLTLILPIHNEEEGIDSVFADIYHVLKLLHINFEILLVENGSKDKTFEKLKAIAKKYKQARVLVASKGYGSAVLAGLAKAKGKYVSYMPSDGQIDMKVYPQLWKTAKNGKYDIVKVKRLHRESLIRTATTRFFSLLLLILFTVPWLDINGSPRIFKRKYLDKLNLVSKDSFIDAEMTIKSHKLHFTFIEIPMENLDRVGGISTRSWKTYSEFIKNIWRFRTSSYLRHWQKNIYSNL